MLGTPVTITVTLTFKSDTPLPCFFGDRVFAIMKMSLRGSIRKAPNVVSWVIFLMKAKEKGSADSSALVRRWNGTATRASHILGPKAQAVKNMLELMAAEERNIVVADIIAKG